MICVDTTFLIDLWRDKDREESAASRLLNDHRGEAFAVPAHAAGEFLEGGVSISPQRMAETLRFLRLFRVGEASLETALAYARLVAHLRVAGDLAGRSKPDLWIAAWAVQHSAPLATRNGKHFSELPGLELLDY